MTLRRTDQPMWKPDKAPKKPRKGLRQVSFKRAKTLKARRAFVALQLSQRPRCEAGERIGNAMLDEKIHATFMQRHMVRQAGRFWACSISSTELHEPLTRARAPGPETILDEANSVAICPGCHSWVHSHPAYAETLGLLKSSRGK